MEEETSPEALLILTAEQDLDAAAEVPIREELVEEVMRELYREIHCEAPSSASATASFLAGGAESCGASVSDSASSVMAGIAPVGPAGYWRGCIDRGPVVVGDTDHDRDEKRMDGCDGDQEEDDGDDEWLARVLSWGPVEVDPIPGF